MTAVYTSARGEPYRVTTDGEAYRGEPRTIAELKADGTIPGYYGPVIMENDGWVLVDGARRTETGWDYAKARWAERINPTLTREEAAEMDRQWAADWLLHVCTAGSDQ